MSKISIRKQRNQSESNGFSVVVSLDDSDEFDGLTVHNPLTSQNKDKLEWHFEEYVSSPYLKEVEPQEAEKIIHEEGENLFSQLFSQPQINNRYQQTIRDGLSNLVIEISGSPEFHSLHWEALKDVNLPSPLALDAMILRSKIVEEELEKENGRIVYSIEIMNEDKKVFDVEVDAETGEIFNVEEEDDDDDDDDDGRDNI